MRVTLRSNGLNKKSQILIRVSKVKNLAFLLGVYMLTEEMKDKLKQKIAEKPLTDEQKARMFDLVQWNCALYGVDLYTEEDAENFWKVLRYK